MLKGTTVSLDYFELIKRSKNRDASACKESLRLAIIADSATQQLAALLGVLFQEHDIRLEVFEGPFDAVELQVHNRNSDLYKFCPDIILILNVTQALRSRYYRRPGSGADFLQEELKRIIGVWDVILEHSSAPVLQSNFVLPVERVFGNFDHKVADSLYGVVAALNLGIAEAARSRSHVFINDVESLASYVGRASWNDNRFWNMYKVFCALEHLPKVAQNIVDVALSVRGRTVKCVVLDLDNTLWGGVIGDDGVDGIALSAHGDGESFYEFQSFVRELQRRGILLAVCSKNNPENALKPFLEHKEMVLHREDIAVFVANWENKADNIKRIRDTLNIGFDSMVFLDDNPFERNLVRTILPEVIVPELPEEPAEYVEAISRLNLFETSAFSAEDTKRTELYRQRAERMEAQSSYNSIEEYLQSLDTRITLGRFDARHIPRIAQLFQRSNQFNLTTRRRSQAECEGYIQDSSCYPIYAELCDRLGDHGLISIVVARHEVDHLFISDWLMSCRVLTRGVEQLLMNHLAEYAARLNHQWIDAEYRPTAKNSMVKDFYAQFGFEKLPDSGDEVTRWRLEVAAYKPVKVFMRVEEAEAEVAASA